MVSVRGQPKRPQTSTSSWRSVLPKLWCAAWQQSHQGELRAARLWDKSYSVPAGGGVLYALSLE